MGVLLGNTIQQDLPFIPNEARSYHGRQGLVRLKRISETDYSKRGGFYFVSGVLFCRRWSGQVSVLLLSLFFKWTWPLPMCKLFVSHTWWNLTFTIQHGSMFHLKYEWKWTHSILSWYTTTRSPSAFWRLYCSTVVNHYWYQMKVILLWDGRACQHPAEFTKEP